MSPHATTLDQLNRLGFTDTMIDSFFRPFFGGITFDTELETSSRISNFVFRMFAEGDAALPADGMDAMVHQLVDRLPIGSLELGRSVMSIENGRVTISNGEVREARSIVLATEEPTAARLLGREPEIRWRTTTCVYYAADRAPYSRPLLYLAGRERGPVNHLAVPSNVAPEYAPTGQSLICANVVGEVSSPEMIEDDVRAQLRGWFGQEVDLWRHLRTYAIPYALPTQNVDRMNVVAKSPKLSENLFRCGDYLDSSSIHGALNSGLAAAAAVPGGVSNE